jgi:hypothetical protein
MLGMTAEIWKWCRETYESLLRNSLDRRESACLANILRPLVGRTGLEPVTNGLKVVRADFLFNVISYLQRLPMFEPNLTQLDS